MPDDRVNFVRNGKLYIKPVRLLCFVQRFGVENRKRGRQEKGREIETDEREGDKEKNMREKEGQMRE